MLQETPSKFRDAGLSEKSKIHTHMVESTRTRKPTWREWNNDDALLLIMLTPLLLVVVVVASLDGEEWGASCVKEEEKLLKLDGDMIYVCNCRQPKNKQ